MKTLSLMIVLAAGIVACSERSASQGGGPSTPPATTLPPGPAIVEVGVTLAEGKGNCAISVDVDPARLIDTDVVRWTADVAPDATDCKGKKFSIGAVDEIDCTNRGSIHSSAKSPLENCNQDTDTGNGGKHRLVCSALPIDQRRCYKYTIKVGTDQLDPEMEVEPGAKQLKH